MVDIQFINILVCVINHCTLECSILYEYREMNVKEGSKIYFSCKASFGRFGRGGGGGGDGGAGFCRWTLLKISKKSIFDKTKFEIQLFISAFKSPNGLQTSRKQHVHILKQCVKQCLTTNPQYIWLALLSFHSNTES